MTRMPGPPRNSQSAPPEANGWAEVSVRRLREGVSRVEGDRLAVEAPLEIRFGAFEVRPVGRELFDLENGAARATLPLPDPAARAAPKGP